MLQHDKYVLIITFIYYNETLTLYYNGTKIVLLATWYKAGTKTISRVSLIYLVNLVTYIISGDR